MRLTLRFDSGSLLIDSDDLAAARAMPAPPSAVLDPRVGRWRAPASAYRELFAHLHRGAAAGTFELEDRARAYEPLGVSLRSEREPRQYQSEAVAAWRAAGRRGLVVLPTGAGKSFVAHLAIRDADRSTLVVVPTLDLLGQWYDGLLAAFDVDEVGMVGGGTHDLRPLTVSTYDSFHIHAARWGDRFGTIVFDEAHHLAGPAYLRACETLIAPFRLGLTATPERPDGRDALLAGPLGPIVYRKEITELAGDFLAAYDVERLGVRLTEAEREAYDRERGIYTEFVRAAGIRFGRADGWSQFVIQSSRSPEGRRAMRAHREQRRLAQTCEQKLALVERLLARHSDERVIVFTADNATVYALSRRLLLPTITHQTPPKERREVLARFSAGTYPALLTSRVLNEGVDVPEANVAIVLSGSGTVREHVQRLGRILRKAEGKRALLYEVVTRDTVEERVSERRREHDAYR